MFQIRRSIPPTLVFLLAAHAASAAGVSLRWTNCVADGGTRNMTFACNTNTGQRGLVASFVLPTAVTASNSVSGIIDIIAAEATLPEWWNYRYCRSGSIVLNPGVVGPTLCTDVYGYCGSGGLAAILPGVPSTNAERIEFTRGSCYAGTFPPFPIPDLAAGVEYLGPVLAINFNRTVGSPSCAGCVTPVCLTLTQLHVSGTTPAGGLVLTDPAITPDGNVVIWQPAGLTPGGVCQAATPTLRRLWGEVKGLYR